MMGSNPLTDITANANNIGKVKPTRSKIPQALSGTLQNENHASCKAAPRFMSPTLSSSRQAASPTLKELERTLTPTSANSSKTKPSTWMSSAARRVGVGRAAEVTTPSGLSINSTRKHVAAILPDRIATPNHDMASGSRIPTPLHTKISVPSDKPLPSPPIVRVAPKSPVTESRTLIDAIEKPLRRSPPGNPHQQEEWPVLFPEKPTTPNTLREMIQPESSETSAVNGADKLERYPKLATVDNTAVKSFTHSKPLKTVSSVQSISRKAVPMANATKTTVDSAAPEDMSSKTQVKSTSDDIKVLDRLSAGAAALEKSSDASNPFAHPRQTRTSSLRARISAGNLVKDGPSSNTKVMGFTDFTTVKEHPLATSNTSKSLSRSPNDARSASERRFPIKVDAKVQNTPTAAHLRNMNNSGSSYDSNDSGSQQFTLSPTAQTGVATVVPLESVMHNVTSVSLSNGVAKAQRAPSTKAYAAITTDTDPFISSSTDSSKAGPDLRNGFKVFEESSNQDQYTAKSVINYRPGPTNSIRARNLQNSSTKQNTTAARREAFTTKRLSATSPELGPVLRISPSAERVIMGHGANKENISTNPFRRKNPDLRRSTITKELQKSARNGLAKSTESRRPMTSQGLPHSPSKIGLSSSEARLKKARSVELSFSVPSKQQLKVDTEQQTSAEFQKIPMPTGDDPFFDARSHQDEQKDDDAIQAEPHHNGLKGDGISSRATSPHWNNPMSSDSVPVTAAFFPASMQDHVGSISSLHERMNNENQDKVSGREVTGSRTPKRIGIAEVSNLLQAAQHAETPRSDSFPPRSSSRTAAIDFATGRLSPYPASNPGNRLSTEFVLRQNKLGTSSGIVTSQVDFAKGISKRESTAELSSKSHGSLSKGVLSNVRGFFHKRSSDHDSTSKPTKKKAGKDKTIESALTRNLPPISDVHPAYRPVPISKTQPLATQTCDPYHLDLTTPVTPALRTPRASEMANTTALAMQILNQARLEQSSPKKERLLELGSVMVEALTQARDAERAMEEAKQAARKAEVAFLCCEKSVKDVTRSVMVWKRELGVE